jgi:hypothetical protein
MFSGAFCFRRLLFSGAVFPAPVGCLAAADMPGQGRANVRAACAPQPAPRAEKLREAFHGKLRSRRRLSPGVGSATETSRLRLAIVPVSSIGAPAPVGLCLAQMRASLILPRCRAGSSFRSSKPIQVDG